jgi:hypothetical protein
LAMARSTDSDGTTKVFDERLSFALEAGASDGTWVEVFPVDPVVAKANENAVRIDVDLVVARRPSQLARGT